MYIDKYNLFLSMAGDLIEEHKLYDIRFYAKNILIISINLYIRQIEPCHGFNQLDVTLCDLYQYKTVQNLLPKIILKLKNNANGFCNTGQFLHEIF